MALGEKRNGSVFATAAQRRDAAEYQVTSEPEIVPVVLDDTPQRTLNTDIGTLRQAHNLFFTPSAEGRDFNSVLQEVQEYISGAYAALITGGGEDSKEQLMRYITKYLQDKRIAVAGMTQTELVDAIYSEMAEFGFLTRYIYADGIEEININSWRDIEVQYSDGRSEKLTEHFDSPEHALAVIRRMLHASGMVLLVGIGAVLMVVGGIDWRWVAAGLTAGFAGGYLMGLLFNLIGANAYMDIPAYYHLIIGGFAFGAVFMATDPVTGSQTNTGKWIYGFLIGALAVLIRVVNPGYPEGMMLSILFMNAVAPLIDYYVVQANVRRRNRRLKPAK